MAITRRQSLFAEREAVYLTDPTPTGTAANAIRMIDGFEFAMETEDGEIAPIDAFLDGFEHIPGKIVATVSFSTLLVGSGNAAKDVPPEIGELFKACGFSETVNAGVSVVYALASAFGTAGTGYQSATFHLQDGTHLIQMSGVYGTCSISADVTTFPKVSWQFTGIYERPTDIPTFTAPTYDTSRPVPSRGMTFSLHGLSGGAALRTQSFTLDLNREVHTVDSMNASFGVAAIELGGCRPSGTFNAQEQTLAGKDWYAAVEAGTLSTMSMVWNGGAGNTTTITDAGGTGGMAMRQLSRGDVNGVTYLDMGYTMGRSAGNDSVTITFT